jgi:hypothetical protein
MGEHKRRLYTPHHVSHQALLCASQQRSIFYNTPRSKLCRTRTIIHAVCCSMVAMNLTATTESKMWGIYHTDREYARLLGDPLRTTVEAPTKEAAEDAAAKLGFRTPWAHPIEPEMVKLMDTVLKKPADQRQKCSHKPLCSVRI